jgi:hypothetical protein
MSGISPALIKGSVLRNTDGIGESDQQPQLGPTAQAYGELQRAYQYVNVQVFRGELPPCLITLQPRAPRIFGYYSSRRFRSNGGSDICTDEIALNPVHFKARDIIEVLQTLPHEMCHLWQHHFGKPSRAGYHNHQWAAKLKDIGLHPSSTGRPGGAIVGQHMADYVIEGGALQQAIHALLGAGFRISWYDRLADFVVVTDPEKPSSFPQIASPPKAPRWVVGTPIVTISAGETRTFRLRPFKDKGFTDFEARHGTVFVMPWDTNLAVKHEVPHRASCEDRRISITARAFA